MLFAVTSVIWGSSFLFIRVAVAHTYVMPVVALVLGVAVLGERLTTRRHRGTDADSGRRLAGDRWPRPPTAVTVVCYGACWGSVSGPGAAAGSAGSILSR